ncbi:hypothetical protein BDN70DRAFT_990722 [Pholiota conissans]|uniref:Uncharacterized protein n=1 Tax=Pholiota conissans TaxID=109636 RepID=A0A9P5Z987_9AGAR|nr:hypothetical protein BDN70DRAFT_990722 [Pholiota conissans]
MPSVPLDIVEAVIETLSQDDLNLSATKLCSLVSHDLHHICRKHIFAAVAINDLFAPDPRPGLFLKRATTKEFNKLLSTKPEIAGYIRILRYRIVSDDLHDLNLRENLKKITQLQYLRFWNQYNASHIRWDQNPLRPALLHLIRLPTLLSVGLYGPDDYVVADMLPNFQQSELGHPIAPLSSIGIGALWVRRMSQYIVTDICVEKSLIDFKRLTNVSLEAMSLEDLVASFALLCKCEWLTKIQIIATQISVYLAGLSQLLSPTLRTLQHVDIRIRFDEHQDSDDPYCGIADGLEEIGGINVIERIDIHITISAYADCTLGDEWGRLDRILTPIAWPKLGHLSLAIQLFSLFGEHEEKGVAAAMQKFPRTQFPSLSSQKSLVFDFSFDEQWIGF